MTVVVIFGIIFVVISAIFLQTIAYQKYSGSAFLFMAVPLFWPVFVVSNWKECDVWVYLKIIGFAMIFFGGGLETLSSGPH